MSITVGDNFSYQGGKPLDARFQFSSVANMKAFAEASLYDGCLAYIPSSKKYYTYDSSNTADQTTGKWRELETGGGGGTSDYNDLTNKPQIESITLSGNQALASFGLTSSVETPLSGSATKSYVSRGEKYNWNTGNTVYGTCSTSASTTAKSVTVSRGTFNFDAGARIAIKFSYSNTASAPTLTVNSTTKNIKCIDETGSTYTPVIWWDANDIVEFVYDGTQFLMQPTTGMVFKIHGTTMNREDIYSTAEKVIGCWTDGRPLYQKTISVGALPNATSKVVNHNISNINHFVEAKGFFWNSSKTGGPLTFSWPPLGSNPDTIAGLSLTTTQIYIGTKSDMSSYTNCYVTLKYTKTTDAANSFKYADPNDYSTSEKIVGTWIDGKTLYQKTVSGTVPTTTDGVLAGSTIATGTTIVTVAHIQNSIYNPNTKAWFALPITTDVVSGNTTKRLTLTVYDKNNSANPNCVGITNSGASWGGCTVYVTIQYTKS